MPQVSRNMGDGTALTLDIEERNAPFGGSIKLEDLRNREAVFESVPNLGRQPVAAAQPDAMLVFVSRRRGVKQVAAEFADVLEYGAVPTGNIVPKLAG